MIPKKITCLLVAIIFLLTTIMNLPISSSQELPPIQIGYSPNGLLDVTLGTLSFMKGEDIWIQSDIRSRVTLIDPDGDRKTSRLLQPGIPVFLHSFAELDKFGNWDVRVSSPLLIRVIEVELTSSEVQVLAGEPQFALESDSITIRGTLELAQKGVHDGGILFLAKSSPLPNTIVQGIPLAEVGGSVEITITQDPLNPRKIAVSLVILVPEEIAETEEAPPPPNIEAVIWAEIIGEVALVKSGPTTVITYVQRTILQTAKSPMILETVANKDFSIELPVYGEVGIGGSIPMRPMSTKLVVYLQVGDIIHLIGVPRFEIEQLMGKVIVDQLEVPPLATRFDYTFNDALDDIAIYDLIYLPNVNGTERVWTTQLRPEVAKVRVLNALTSFELIDYVLVFKEGMDSVNLGGVTYVLLSDRSVVLSGFDLLVQGQVLDMNHRSPDRIRLETFMESTITVSLGRVSFDVTDGVGNDVDSGTITLSAEGQRPFILEWSDAQFPIDVLLPSGLYDTKVVAGGEVESFSFIVNKADTNIDVVMQSIVYIPTEFYILIASLGVIMVEVVIVVKVWRKALLR